MTRDNFCDIGCVQKIYDFYCGGVTCTTGAVDYVQIYALCDDVCTSAILGEVMLECLENANPDRDDWTEIQDATFDEIYDFCAKYRIFLNEDVKPLAKNETDANLIKTLYDDPVTNVNDTVIEDDGSDIDDGLYDIDFDELALESEMSI